MHIELIRDNENIMMILVLVPTDFKEVNKYIKNQSLFLNDVSVSSEFKKCDRWGSHFTVYVYLNSGETTSKVT